MYEKMILYICLLFLFDRETKAGSICEGPDGNGNLPWDQYADKAIPPEQRATNALVQRYKNLDSLCCDKNTAYLKRAKHMMWDYPFTQDPNSKFPMGTTNHCQYVYRTTEGGHLQTECRDICFEFYQKYVMGASNIQCLSGLHIMKLPNCTDDTRDHPSCGRTACVVYNVLPEDMGGGPTCELHYDVWHTEAYGYYLNPKCDLTGNEYYKSYTPAAPRDACNRELLPWDRDTRYRAYKFEPPSEDSGVRIRLFEKLHPSCCSDRTANTLHFGRKYKDDGPCRIKGQMGADFILSVVWSEPTPSNLEEEVNMNNLMAERCRKECYRRYQKWILDIEEEPCISAMFDAQTSEKIATVTEYHCRMFSKARYNGLPCYIEEIANVFAKGKAIASYGKYAIIELLEQCTLDRDVQSYSYSRCIDTTSEQPDRYRPEKCRSIDESKWTEAGCHPNKCQGFVHYKGTIFMECVTPNTTLYVESINWWHNEKQIDPEDSQGFVPANCQKKFCFEPNNSTVGGCKIDQAQPYLNALVKYAGFPQEIEFSMLIAGIRTCDTSWDRLVQTPEKSYLQITYHCANLADLQFNTETTPKAYDVENMGEDCLNYAKAFTTHAQSSIGQCNPYATEQVSAEWRCRDNCLAYFINAYNYDDFTYDGKGCRATVSYTDGEGVTNCLMFDWAPHETPVDYRVQRQHGCSILESVPDKTLYLLDTTCYAVSTPTPGMWEPGTAIAYIPKKGCTSPHTAFEPYKKQIVCPSAAFWKAMGRNPGRERNGKETVEDYFENFLDEGDEGNERLVQMYGEDWRGHIEQMQIDRAHLGWHCMMSCLDMHQRFYEKTQTYDRPCRAVMALARKVDDHKDFKLFCIYKDWPMQDTDQCLDESFDFEDFDSEHFSMFEAAIKKECYGPRDPLPHLLLQTPTTTPAPGPPTAPDGYPDNYDSCFTKDYYPAIIQNDVYIYTPGIPKKLPSCKTNQRAVVYEQLGRDEVGGLKIWCAIQCLHAARDYWYRRQYTAADAPDCKAYAYRYTPDIGDEPNPWDGKRIVECFFYNWKRGNKNEECPDTVENSHPRFRLINLNDNCQEPKGMALRTCQRFEETGLVTHYTLVTEDATAVHHGGRATFACKNEVVGRFDCNNGIWERYCDGSAYPCQGKGAWHYNFEFKKWYKLFEKRVNFIHAYDTCEDNCFGKLVAIHSKAENEYVSEVADHKETWIGLKNIHAFGKWFWEDGSEVNYISDLGRCPNLECDCDVGRKCSHSDYASATCVLSQFKEWYWVFGDDTCYEIEADKTVCQYPMKEAVLLAPKDVDETDEERKQQVWDDICRKADREGNKAQLAICKEVRKCKRYLERHGTYAKTAEANKCRELLQIKETKCRKYSGKWCRDKAQAHGSNPKLSCIKKCNGILSIMGKYSKSWCEAKIEKHGKKPNLACIKKCKKQLEQEGNTKPQEVKFGYDYCSDKMVEHSGNPKLSCIKICRKKFPFLTVVN